jgi:CheY-like chemotaxis protein
MSSIPSVLIVDDDAATRALFAAGLTIAGFEVAQACSGTQALACVRGFQPDVVLMDLAMPDMNGAEAIRRLKTASDTLHIHVFVVTGYATPQALSVARAAGAEAVFVKPVEIDEIVTAIRRVRESAAVVRPRPSRTA